MFPREQWYVAAWSRDVSDRPVGRVFLQTPVVLFRKPDGSVAALEDCCPHRNLPLSMGRLVGDQLQCGYHGLQFDAQGRCVHAPGETGNISWANVRTYPVAERHGWVFIWMGDPAKADESTIINFHSKLSDPNWSAVIGEINVKCGYRLILDNLLDLSHLAYVHSASTGNAALAENAKITTASSGSHVRVTRYMNDIPPAPAYKKYGRYAGNVDRWQISNFYPPAYIYINNGSFAAGQVPNGYDINHQQGHWGFQVYQAMTPITETSCFLYWAVAHENRYFSIPEEVREFQEAIKNVLEEDRLVYEGQQRSVQWHPESKGDVNPKGTIQADQGLLKARQILRRLTLDEQKKERAA